MTTPRHAEPIELPQIVTCSCGAKTTLRFDEALSSADSKPGGRYVASGKGWRFRQFDPSLLAKNQLGLGWYCGHEAHFQAIEKPTTPAAERLGIEG